MNETILNNDHETYKKIVKTIVTKKK
jgi:hypothetical protein